MTTLQKLRPPVSTAQRPPAERPTAPRTFQLTFTRFVIEAVAGAAIAVVVSLLLQVAVLRLSIPEPSLLPTVLASLCSATLVAVVTVLATSLRASAALPWAGYAAVSALPTLLLAIPLHGTRWFLGGLASDNQFRIAYVTRFASSPHLADFAYQGVPPLYPPGWFWAAGRTAALLGIDGWAVFKPLSILSTALAAAVALSLWRLLVTARLAMLLAGATSACAFVEPSLGVREPYAWLVGAALPPLTVIAYRVLGDDRTRWRALASLGASLGLAVLCYTMLAAFWAFCLLVLVGIRFARHPGCGATLLLRTAVVAGVAAPAGCVVLLPYWLASLPLGSPSTTALKFIPYQQITYLLPMTSLDPPGVLCLTGTAWLLLRARKHAVAGGLLVLVCCCYAWSVLSQLAIAAGTTLLSFRVHPVLLAALYCAGILAVGELLVVVRRRPQVSWRASLPVFAGLAALLAVSTLQHAHAALTREVDLAYRQSYPLSDGSRPARTARVPDPGRTDEWLAPLDEAIEKATGKQPQELVVLTDVHRLTSVRPYWSYLTSTPGYSNPLGRHEERNEEVKRWLRACNAQSFTLAMASGAFRPPDVFVLTRVPGGFDLTLTHHHFPRVPTTSSERITIPTHLFDESSFTRQDVGPYTVLTARHSAAPTD
ncbi:arabinofuranosyltransferase [Streptomyces himalayensis]|uniref:Galactan 5-O-arabinofuranosyltransferase n=1 Tax=Streptomyces himalayensis subsp. himalayensis TaxID=2756131 RepID=A0A7W0DFV0_9ACTN|nr:arabinofuranosyltransferase [Streptomyces himalayensis]MBA2944292.1 arabinofuranosyltransferase [Streptomyces himalayensis subsp. himalayensis]